MYLAFCERIPKVSGIAALHSAAFPSTLGNATRIWGF